MEFSRDYWDNFSEILLSQALTEQERIIFFRKLYQRHLDLLSDYLLAYGRDTRYEFSDTDNSDRLAISDKISGNNIVLIIFDSQDNFSSEEPIIFFNLTEKKDWENPTEGNNKSDFYIVNNIKSFDYTLINLCLDHAFKTI